MKKKTIGSRNWPTSASPSDNEPKNILGLRDTRHENKLLGAVAQMDYRYIKFSVWRGFDRLTSPKAG